MLVGGNSLFTRYKEMNQAEEVPRATTAEIQSLMTRQFEIRKLGGGGTEKAEK